MNQNDPHFPTSLKDVLGPGWQKRVKVPTEGESPNLLRRPAPAPPLPEGDLVVDERLASALGGGDTDQLH